MKLLALFAAVLLTVSASTDKDQWVAFKQTHGKTYKSLLEERTRFGIFQNNLQLIEEHNAKYAKGEKTYYLGITPFADMTHQEFKHLLGLQNKNKPTLNATVHQFPENLEAPQSINWVQEGAVLPVKHQMNCGSCWAFSAIGSLEGQNIILNNDRTPLSQQQLVDCSSEYGNGDCNSGGYMTYAFDYIRDKGIEAYSSYPYVGFQSYFCKYNIDNIILRIKGHRVVEPTENHLKNAVGTIGPISIGVNAQYLQHYKGGVLNERKCDNADDKIDHAVLAVGYDSIGGTKYWLIKNSWGPTWGEEGYFKLARDAGNMCGVASIASYPLLI